jgi:hypothetical protein
LNGLFLSEEWDANKLPKTQAGKDVHDIVLSMEFWNSIVDYLRVSAPLLIVLRVVDGDERPAMPEVTTLMNLAKEKIKLILMLLPSNPVSRKLWRLLTDVG